MRVIFRHEVTMSFARTGLLLAALTGLFLMVGLLVGGGKGAIIAFVVALAMNGLAYWNSDRMVLRLHGARPVTPQEAPDLFAMVHELAGRAGLPMPALYVIDSRQPNAFATGRDPEHSAVAVTRGLLDTLSREEVAGVVAHELAHIKHRDTLTMTMAATIAGAIGFLANFAMFFGGSSNRNNPLGLVGTLLAALLAPLVATIIQLAVSRSREFAADAEGARICGRADWLARALARLDVAARSRQPMMSAERSPATAHLFIVNPLLGGRVDRLFRTHPPMEERIARLSEMIGNMEGFVQSVRPPEPWTRAMRRGSVPDAGGRR